MTWKCNRCGEENDDSLADCLACKEANKPYYRKSLAESKSDRDQFTCELNREERAWLENLKGIWDIKSDSKAMKLALEIAINNTKTYWSADTWRFVLNTKRQRLSNFQKLPEPTSNENARQI